MTSFRGRHRRQTELPDTMTSEEFLQQQASSQRNKRNRAEGEDFQKRLDAYHAQLAQRCIAEVYRTQPSVAMIGPSTAKVIGKGPVDYIAFRSGSPIHFDAKSRQGDAFSISTKSQHQTDWLDRMLYFGHIVGLVVYWRDYDECRWHTLDSIDGKRVRRADGILCTDVEWLSVAQ